MTDNIPPADSVVKGSRRWTHDEVRQLVNDGSDPDSIGVAHTLSKICQSLTAFIRSLYRHKRTPAIKVYVLMINNETRQAKPYALPIQLLPYASLNTNTMQRLLQDIVQSMTVRGMNVVGKSDFVLSMVVFKVCCLAEINTQE